MVRPRRLSDSSVSSVCSDNESNYTNTPGMSASVSPHVRTPNVSLDTFIDSSNMRKCRIGWNLEVTCVPEAVVQLPTRVSLPAEPRVLDWNSRVIPEVRSGSRRPVIPPIMVSVYRFSEYRYSSIY